MDSYIWAMFFAGLVSIKAHPRNEVAVNFDECAVMADHMFVRYKERFPCPGSSPVAPS